MTTTLVFPPDLDPAELIKAIENSLAKARERAEGLDRLDERVHQEQTANQAVIASLESSLAAAQGGGSASAKANGAAKPERPKASRRPPTATKQRAKRAPAQKPAEELLRVCGSRAFDTVLAWARERQEFAPEEFQPPNGMTVPQSRAAFRALLADGALIEENGRRHFVREPTIRSLHQQILDYLAEHGSKTQPELVKALESTQGRISTAVRELVKDVKVTNTPQPTGTTKLVALVGTSDGAS